MAPRATNAGAVAQEVEAPMRAAEYSQKTLMRFWTKVQVGTESECWLWRASKTVAGYGQFNVPGETTNRMAHRFSYELLVGPIPEGLHIDHLCRTPACVNPAHMEPVTCAENLRRGSGFAGRNAQKTHCVRGHELAGENLYVDPKGRRQCKACRRAAQVAYNQRHPGTNAARSREWRAAQRDAVGSDSGSEAA